MFPGAGYLLISKYLRGYLLFLFEIIVNLQAHVNMALFYMLLGEFELSKQVIDIRWSLLYIPTYAFAIWDSYRAASDLNKHYILASRENAPIKPFVSTPLGLSYLDQRAPFTATAWCALSPGLGHVMLQRLHQGFFILIWWIVICYHSNILTAVHHMFYGEFTASRDVLNMQWFLNLPSLFFFCIYTTYVNTVESNKLFEREQSQYLAENYQNPAFTMPVGGLRTSESRIYIVSVYKQSLQVELAVTALEEEGIGKNDILAVPVEKETRRKKLYDTMRSSTGDSVFDMPMALGSLTTLFGCVYGFKLTWGPVLWGIIAGALGFCIGFIIKLLIVTSKKDTGQEKEVVIIVACENKRAADIKRLLKDNGALGVSSAG